MFAEHSWVFFLVFPKTDYTAVRLEMYSMVECVPFLYVAVGSISSTYTFKKNVGGAVVEVTQ